ncbi:MAG: hypothetical protein FWF15_09370, partial [Oscillospiraceae bacterium]|nr:hypothetical protein [Oscillospiraceae bacterium]
MKKYFLNGPEDYKLMSQTGVRQYCYPLDYSHNAIWDSNINEDGKLYFALASEICTSEYVRLCSYDYASNTVTEHFRATDVILPSDRTIRASKFHTSICFMQDDTVVMTTHTTDKAPAHPTWLPEAFYHHIWEGYPGSQILTYNPATGEAKNHGTPVPRESIYGSIYDPKHNSVYFLGMFRGHLYRYSFDDKLVYDYGQVSECRAFRLSFGSDGNLYGASKSGWVFKVDTETNVVTDLNFCFKHISQEYFCDYTDITIARIGPDRRLYMVVMYSRSIYALDTNTGIFEDMGEYLNAEHHCRGENRNGIFGMDFDSKGALWYVVTSRNDGRDGLEFGLPASLFCWDITRGGKPQWAGLCGTPDRVGSWVSEVSITKDDILYVIGSNHGKDGPDITAIDLKLFEPKMSNLGGNTNDSYYDPNNEHYIKIAQELKDEEDVMAENPFGVDLPMPKPPVNIWRALAPDNIAASSVRQLEWISNDRLVGYCAGKETVRIANSYRPGDDEKNLEGAECFKFAIDDGELSSIERSTLP